MDTANTNTAAPWGLCVLCGRRILTSFYLLPGDGYTVRAHDGCYDARALTGAEQSATQAAQMAKLDRIEALLGGRVTA